MDFAADAVFDAIAPQPRTANARPTRADESQPSFDDHLEAANADEAPPIETSAAPSEKPEASEKASAPDAEPADLTGTAQAPSPPQSTPQFIVQLVAPEAPVVAPIEATTDADVAATAPANAQPAAPAPPPLASAEAKPDADAGDGTTKAQNAQSKSDADAPKADAAPVSADAPEAAPPPPVQNSAPPASSPINATPISADASEAIASIAAQTAPTPQPVAKDATPRVAKSESKAEGEIEFKPDTNAVATQPAAARATPKSGAATQANKDANIAVSAPAVDTPEAPAPTPQSATISAPSTTQTQHATLDVSAQRAAPATAQVAREIVKRFNGENTRFEMRLDPPELGRVEVRLEVSRDHRVTAVLSADSPQALNELARHARDLEQMLQASGLELSENGLSFDLRHGSEDADTNDASSTARGVAASEDAPQQQTTTARPLGYERWRGVRVDVMV